MSPMVVTFVILIGAVVLLLSEKLRPDLVALMVLVSLGGCGVLSQQEAFSGFSRSAVITILAVFILAEGLLRIGVADHIGAVLLRLAGKDERRLLVAVMGVGAFLSLFMNNIAAASVVMPAVAGASRRTGVSPSRLLMPLAFATILGGMATLLTTTNLVASGVLRDQGRPGLGVLSFAPVGLPLLAAGIAYMVFWGRRLLPSRTSAERQAALEAAGADLIDVYRLGEKLFRARIPVGSTLHNRRISESALRERFRLAVVAIERNPHVILSPSPDVTIKEDDVLVLKGEVDDFRSKDTAPFLEILPSPRWTDERLSSPTDVVVEAMLSPRSELIGHSIRSARFRVKYGMNVLALWRTGRQLRVGIGDIPLEFGDALLLQGPRAQLPVLRTEKDFILMAEEDEDEPARPPVARRWKLLAVAIFTVTFVLAAIFSDQVGEIMLAGAVGMLLCNILTMDDAYNAIDWRSIVLIAGMLPLGLAMSKTGAAQLMADHLTTALAPVGPIGLLAALCLASVLLTQVMNGAAVTAVVAPIAIQAADHAGLSPRALVMGVALATSMAFLTPLGHPVNVLVMGQGGYRFRDYGRVGIGLTLLLMAILLLLLPLVCPL